MRALVKAKDEPGVWLTEVPEPEVGPGDVLIRVLRTGICGTDLHIAAWDDWARANVPVPLVIGHEFVGEVAATGSQVTGIPEGALVSGEGHLICGTCRNCRAGKRHLCARTQGLGVNRSGAFAEYVALPAENVWVHSGPMDLDVAAVFDPFGNAVHTATAFPLVGEDVLITGAGPIGVMATAVARHSGARTIVVSDVSEYRLGLARQAGATETVDVSARRLADVRADLGLDEGFGVALEMSGQASALRELIANMRHGGRVAMLGLPDREIAVDWSVIVQRMLTVRGIYGREMFETWYAMAALLERGLDLSPVITHRFGFEDYEEAFETARAGRCGKVVLDWSAAA
ncbi:L-threonine 3-dehydrogenase [Bailinhaonella thermotolerans]|uniref:L-threonine 3-dehydrogenase n=1 Tax=Bailinhaonella thermotolerans TaxID=1070861 RepID=A0A3A4AZL7_9ACTN|nr:L-threonine 3-dehydrogenase [Bailinhaonella thermotolerans]RJL36132.1 L-threonine 3-dehydrogenase [Bailinhaonella thermotolerans]